MCSVCDCVHLSTVPSEYKRGRGFPQTWSYGQYGPPDVGARN